MSNFVNVSSKYFGSTLAISESESRFKLANDNTSIFFLVKYSKLVLFTDSEYGVNIAIFFIRKTRTCTEIGPGF